MLEANAKNTLPQSSVDLVYASPATMLQEDSVSVESIGLEVIEQVPTQEQPQCPAPINTDYEENDMPEQSKDGSPAAFPARLSSPPPPPPPRLHTLSSNHDESKRSFPLSNFLLEAGVLFVLFILCMVLVLAIRETQNDLRMIMEV